MTSVAKKQTRKSISISNTAYTAAKPWAHAQGKSLSSVVESWLREQTALPPITTPWSRPGLANRFARGRDVTPPPADGVAGLPPAHRSQ